MVMAGKEFAPFVPGRLASALAHRSTTIGGCTGL